jgi:hypothetical protein
VSLGINPISSGQLNKTNVTVTGTISDDSLNIWVNGVRAGVSSGLWSASNVPVSPSGTAVVTAEAGTDTNDIVTSQTMSQPQPAVVVLSDYSNVENDQYYDVGEDGREFYESDNSVVHWTVNAGGNYADRSVRSFNEYPYGVYPDNYGGSVPGGAELGPPWEYALLNGAGDDNVSKTTQSTLTVEPPGQAAAGASALYLVMAGASDFSEVNGFDGIPDSYFSNNVYAAGDLPMPPEWLQVNGQALVSSGITNTDGSVEGLALISAPSGAPVKLALSASQFHYYADATFTNVLAQTMHLAIIDTNSGTDLTLQTNTVIVGQQMNWYCKLSITNSFMTNFPPANFQWTVPGFAASNFVADASSDTVYTNFLMTSSNINFYWVDGASNRIVQVSATVNGKTITGHAAFNVLRPTAKISPWTTSVRVHANLLSFDSSTMNGITFSNTIAIPTNFPGSIEWVQVDFNPVTELQDTNSTWHILTNYVSGPYLDTTYPYQTFSGTNAVDSPALPLPSQYVRGVASDVFEMWMMFKPNGGQWVPLRAVNWSWSGSATNGPSGWSLQSGTNSINPTDFDTQTYPI